MISRVDSQNRGKEKYRLLKTMREMKGKNDEEKKATEPH